MSKVNLLTGILCVCCSFINFCSAANNKNNNWMTTTSFGYDFLNTVLTNNESESVLQLKCLQQLRELQRGIDMHATWALKFIDAWAKFPAGFLYGHLTEMGHFEECLSIQQETHNTDISSYIKGKYCLTEIPIENLINDEFASNKQKNINLGICLPAACSANEINFIFNEYLRNEFQINIDKTTVLVRESNCKESEKMQFGTLDWIAMCIFLTLGILMLANTFYDYRINQLNTKPNPLYLSFSIRTNLRNLVYIKTVNNNPDVIPCLHGIRCMALIWIIFGHCYMLMLPSPSINTQDVITWLQSPFSMFHQSNTVTVDTFFFISGLLVAFISMRAMDKNFGKLKIHRMYIHRYIRLTPVVAMAILMFMTFYRYLSDGPMWDNVIYACKLCDETWWATLLFVQNYAAAGRMCLGHTWYLAADTQLFFISPLILIALWKWKSKGLLLVAFLGLLLFACLFSIIVLNSFTIFPKPENAVAKDMQMRQIYYSTHARALPWIIGIVFGYLLHKQKGSRSKLSVLTVSICWLLSILLLLTCVFALFPKTQADATPLSPLHYAFYVSLSRIAWPLALCWIVFACINNYGGPINQFLSNPLWQPLSKLSYCMYIVHLLVEMVNAGRIKTNTHFSNYDVILRFWGDFGITLLVSTVLYLAVEAPMAGIEKFLSSHNQVHTIKKETIPTTTISRQYLCE